MTFHALPGRFDLMKITKGSFVTALATSKIFHLIKGTQYKVLDIVIDRHKAVKVRARKGVKAHTTKAWSDTILTVREVGKKRSKKISTIMFVEGWKN